MEITKGFFGLMMAGLGLAGVTLLLSNPSGTSQVVGSVTQGYTNILRVLTLQNTNSYGVGGWG